MAAYSVFPFTDDPITFDENDLGFVTPGLAAVKGFQLSEEELGDIFGIEQARFGTLPKRLVVPVLTGEHTSDDWYRVKGWLYQVEPVEWVPVVESEHTMPRSEFTTEYVKTEFEKSETTFNASASASLTIEGGGSYYGITASVKSENTVSFEVKKSRSTEEQWKTTGTTGSVPFHKLFVYPLLRCRIVKRQLIDYTVNSSSKELKWDDETEIFTDYYWVGNGRLSELRKLQFNPVPMKGWGVNGKTLILPVPKVENGVFSVTTVMSRTDWVDWYVYDREWEDVHDHTMDFSAPTNDTAFRPMSTVIRLKRRTHV